jgi:heme-binding protein
VKKAIKRIGIAIVVLLVVIQVFRPARTNPAVDQTRTIQANSTITPQISAIFERSCKDCHSSRTIWPWYSEVAPVSWLLVSDVNGARKQMSLSEWGTYDSTKKVSKLQKICEEVESGDMPLGIYVALHPVAKLSDADKQALCDWTKQESDRVLASPATASK